MNGSKSTASAGGVFSSSASLRPSADRMVPQWCDCFSKTSGGTPVWRQPSAIELIIAVKAPPITIQGCWIHPLYLARYSYQHLNRAWRLCCIHSAYPVSIAGTASLVICPPPSVQSTSCRIYSIPRNRSAMSSPALTPLSTTVSSGSSSSICEASPTPSAAQKPIPTALNTTTCSRFNLTRR